MKYKIIPIFFLLSLLIIISLQQAKADTFTQIKGNWNINQTYPNYVDTNNTVGVNTIGITKIEMGNVTIGENEGIEINFTINKLKADYQFFSGIKRLWVAEELTDNTISAFGKIYIAHEQGLGYETGQVQVGSKSIVPYTDLFGGAFDNSKNFTNTQWSLQLQRKNDTVISAYLMQLNEHITDNGLNTDFSRMVFNETFTVNNSFWNNTKANIYLAHDGIGTANITINGYGIQEINLYQRNDYSIDRGNIFTLLWNMVIVSISILFGVLWVLSGVLLLILPYVPWIFIAVLGWKGWQCIKQRSLDPIIEFGMMLWGVAIQAWTLITAIGTAIWNTLPFHNWI